MLHLTIELGRRFVCHDTQPFIETLSGFTALRSFELKLKDVDVTAPVLPGTIRVLLQSAPELKDLAIHATLSDDMDMWPFHFSAPASSLFSELGTSRPARLRSLTIEGSTFTVNKGLASHVDLKSLERLVLWHDYILRNPLVEDDFWPWFKVTACTAPGGLKLKHLTSSRLSPGLMEFLLSYRALEELCFSSGFYPVRVPDFDLETAGPDSTGSENESTSTDQPLVDKFFKTVLPIHKDRLRSLALCGELPELEPWKLKKEHLDSVMECQGLTSLHIPFCQPVVEKDLVSVSRFSNPYVPLLTF